MKGAFSVISIPTTFFYNSCLWLPRICIRSQVLSTYYFIKIWCILLLILPGANICFINWELNQPDKLIHNNNVYISFLDSITLQWLLQKKITLVF